MDFVEIFMIVISIVVSIIVIRYAINSSKIIIRMDAMLQEMRALRKEIQENHANEHIIDKKV
ncbi:hypothetical protein [Paenibacillus sp. FSL H8-457]|uniref:hypothetical protein n=2 Tax=unclassified Paenibacillus TaxID=185978 RepID=UPI0003E28B72|nr:hypothetical protein [Paenibacillus sp. FSL H8-457]ETT62141.1 hypothetical protein C172_16936 [Paenibacillus sp. FSL H8-457]